MRIPAILLIMGVALMLGASACSSVGGKAAKRKVKMATPGVDAKGEKATKRAKDIGNEK